MDQNKALLEKLLRAGDVPGALNAARAILSSGAASPRDAAIEIARTAGVVYRDFVTEPIIEFAEVAQSLHPEGGPLINKALARLFRMSEEWEPKLRSVYEERLARELRDFLREGQMDKALRNMALLLQPAAAADNESQRATDHRQRVHYIGNVLGTCINHPSEAQELISLAGRNGKKLGLTAEDILEMRHAQSDRHGQMMGGRLENLENIWSAQLNRTQSEIADAMPAKNLMDEPDETNLRDIGDLFRTILRLPIDLDVREMMTDATLLLRDFTPKEVAAAAKSSGVESRSYGALGMRARRTVMRVFMEIGQSPNFSKSYLEWAGRQTDSPHFEAVVELMGALRSEAFGPFFLGLWKSKPNAALKQQVSRGLANLGTAEAAEVLMQDLADIFENKAQGVGQALKRLNEWKVTDKAIDAGSVRQAQQLLASLGRTIRSPRTSDAVRRRIIEFTTRTVPQDNRALRQAITTEILAAKPDALEDKERLWAIRSLVEALWVQDQSTQMHRGGERDANIVGSREPLMIALGRFAANGPREVVAALEPYAAKPSGGMLASAEALKDSPSPEVVELFNHMLSSITLDPLESRGAYQQETYWDTTDQQRKVLTTDKVTSTIVFILGQWELPEARELLEDYAQRIRSNVLPNPGAETIGLLAKYLGPSVGASASAAEAAASGGASPSGAASTAVSERPRTLLVEADPAEVRQLVKALTGSYLLTSARKKAEAKITALVRLGQVTPPEAIEAIVDHTGDADTMVANAARTALVEYVGRTKPKDLLMGVGEALLKTLNSQTTEKRLGALKAARELATASPDLRRMLADDLDSLRHPDVRRALQQLAATAASTPSEVAAAAGPRGEVGEAGKAKSNLDLLEAKREYMAARQEWIRGGKKGDPPQPPPGVM